MKSPRILAGALVAVLSVSTASAAPADPLETGFHSPPDSAKPHTWWHWMNGNITREGITADLEAMKHIGVGGAQIFNVDEGIPHGPVQFMSPEWRQLFQHAVKEADRLGVELCVHNCAGWSSSGGPWNDPEHAMQKVVTSEVRVTGPTSFADNLPQPPTTLGFYRDIAVLAFPAPAAETATMKDALPVVTTSPANSTAANLCDGKPETVVTFPVPAQGQTPYAQLEFPKAFTAYAVRLQAGRGMGECQGVIQVSDDGRTFRTLRGFSFGRRVAGPQVLALGAGPATGRFWRVQFNSAAAATQQIALAEIDLSPRLVIENLDAKAGYSGDSVRSSAVTAAMPGETIPRERIVDLTSRLEASGRLTWQVPAGDWVLLRVGYTPTGRNNHPAPVEGTGLECDKLSREALDRHWAGFMQKILDDAGPLAGKSLKDALIDSYEVGGQNWTARFREEFQKRRGYDLLRFLPTFTGRVVDSPEIAERFLWDVRRTIADLFAENYYGHFAELCRQHGLLASIEPYTGPFESLQCGAPADIVMGEFWSGSQGHPSVKLAASVAHIYGKQLVGAESFTASPEQGRWLNDPYSLKALGDLMYCQGLNRYIFHRYAMQPWTNRWPGMTMGQWGFHFERTVTWWEQGKAWLDYVARCQFLLQQGRAVADAAYFCGESAPVEMRVGDPVLPAGYDYDAINADVLLHRAAVKNGRLTLPDGMSYAALILPPSDADLTPQLLQRILELVREGATVVGPPPQHSPSLEDYPACDARVKELAGELWGKCDGRGVTENVVGRGRVIWGRSLADVFSARALKPDFEFHGRSPASRLVYVHRVAGDSDIYFVSNQRPQFETAECTFRVNGKAPEFWHPDTDTIEPAPIWSEQDGRVTVRLQLDPAGSAFVVCRRPAGGADHAVAASDSASKPEAPASPKVEIRHAVYEAVDGAGSNDVTARLTELVRSGETAVSASNEQMGGDPTYNHVKQLRVEYTLDGKSINVTVPENETLTLAAPPAAGGFPAWQPVVGREGRLLVKTWTNGVFELRTARGRTLKVEARDVPAPREIAGAWNVRFPPNWEAPAQVQLDKLLSWSDHADRGIRYFSGTATYGKEIEVPAEWLRDGRELWLDLGRVKNFADVALNGQNLGTFWKPPFRVNLTSAAKPGANRLEVKVTNLWPNRLIGDEQLPDDRQWTGKRLASWPDWLLAGKPSPTGRLTFTTWHHWTKDAPLLESGLLGPVTLQAAALLPAE